MWSRRQLLQHGAIGTSGIAAAAVLSACGSDRNNGAGDSPASALPEPPAALEPFDSTRPAGPATGLPRRAAWANTASVQFFLALSAGMEAASKERGLQYLTAVSGDDPAANLRQLESFVARGIGALAFQPLDQQIQRPVLEAALRQGICVQGLISPTSTLQIAASQYNIGFTQGKAAADYIVQRLQSKAAVHYFNGDSVSPQLKLRHTGVLDGLRTGGAGIRVVSDVAGLVDYDEGGEIMREVIAEYPDIKVILGGDAAAVGAYRELDRSGKLTEDMYFSGVDGDREALTLVKARGPYRASIAFAWQLMGYGLGRFAADWIDGKDIPRVVVAAPIVVDSPEGVDAYLADNANPGAVFAVRQRYERYLPLLGNVSYRTRETIWRDEYIPN
ncbi:sugar ABC transporter substrate-binding protein [Antrihabitans stalactiti]|uniref:Sugar ABC transporter substrate-binding protein n=1 Tax=Antrihabitans stalactiti TaxID=2584121 RepID=A0A848KHT3_9NOCA|nr:sugar ABC transporter substrate-binding protein [Antrihabitans stalactiti]NMN98593.1 sugar ABC transporter substrate-binding protein [Antrihabitans stalactiti]